MVTDIVRCSLPLHGFCTASCSKLLDFAADFRPPRAPWKSQRVSKVVFQAYVQKDFVAWKCNVFGYINIYIEITGSVFAAS